MATIDRREGDGIIHSEMYLKIWRWNQQGNIWLLNTRVDRPHGTSNVTDVDFNPSASNLAPSLLVTTGVDSTIKIWRLKQSGKSAESGR